MVDVSDLNFLKRFEFLAMLIEQQERHSAYKNCSKRFSFGALTQFEITPKEN